MCLANWLVLLSVTDNVNTRCGLAGIGGYVRI